MNYLGLLLLTLLHLHAQTGEKLVAAARKQIGVTVSYDPGPFLPGDIVTCTVPQNLPHVMLVSDRKTAGGVPLVIHNSGAGTHEDDMLFRFPLTGHYRLK